MKKITCILGVILILASTVTVAYAREGVLTENFPLDAVQIAQPSVSNMVTSSSTAFNEAAETCQNVLINDTTAYVEYIPKDEIIISSIASEEKGIAPYSSHYFSLDGLPVGSIVSDGYEYEVQEGETVTIDISSSTWYPHTCTIHIGLYDLWGEEGRYDIFTGGSFSGSITFRNLAESTYMVYVRNVGSQTITDGGVRYSVS